jgi:hypothetical protein
MKQHKFDLLYLTCKKLPKMFLFEFNNLDIEDKRDYINELPPTSNDRGRFVTYRKEGDIFISLWDCDTFFAEMYALNKEGIQN